MCPDAPWGDVPARHERVVSSIRLHLRAVEEEFRPPHQARLLAQLDDTHEEAFEQRQTEPLADAGQAGVVRQRLIQVIAQVPAMREVKRHRLHQLALGAQTLEEEDELELEEDDRVDAGSAALRVAIGHPLTHEVKIQDSLEVAVEVIAGDQLIQ